MLTDASGKLIGNGISSTKDSGKQKFEIVPAKNSGNFVMLTVVFDDKFYVTKKLLKK